MIPNTQSGEQCKTARSTQYPWSYHDHYEKHFSIPMCFRKYDWVI